ncbi:MAG: hypothetical protein IJ595_04760 [Oscillospiraceae bacterium]|nr:hypothetical protein [Oscillospiraceae bacterium]
MSSRSKLLISVLFIAAIILCIALTRMYLDGAKNTGHTDANDQVKSIVRTYGSMRVFESTNGYYGILNEDDAVMIEPEWMEVLDVTDSLVVVSRRIEDAVLIGGIDYEENVVLPFVFSSMEPVGNGYFLGTVAEDDSILVYDRAFRLAFPRSYEKAEADDSGMLSLTVSDCVFDYYLGGDSPVLRRASMTSDICGVALQWRVANQVYLNDLNENDLLRINKIVTSYMLMLQESSFDELPAISASDYIAGLTKPGSFAGMAFDEISGFSFASADGNSAYDFSFTASYHLTDAGAEQMPGTAVQVQLRFRRNTDNKMILTSSNLNFQGAASAVTEPEDEGTE